MSKISLNLSKEFREKLDHFVESSPVYSNRSDFIRDAVASQMESGYSALREVEGSWKSEEAKKARERIRELEKVDLAAREASE